MIKFLSEQIGVVSSRPLRRTKHTHFVEKNITKKLYIGASSVKKKIKPENANLKKVYLLKEYAPLAQIGILN